MGSATLLAMICAVAASGQLADEDQSDPEPEAPGAAEQSGDTARATAPSDESIEEELRRAKNEYAYGNYEESVSRYRALLYPMRLRSDQQVIEARRYLALNYYLLNEFDLLEEEFSKLLFIDPNYELDPFSIAPPVIERFEAVRKRLKPELDAIRQLKADEQLDPPVTDEVVRLIERRIIERSELETFLPFGVGQFQNGDTGLGIFFAVSEALLLAVNVGSFLYARYGIGTGFSPTEQDAVRALALAQYGSLVLFGTVYSLGVFEARLNFVPTIEAPATMRDSLSSRRSAVGAAIQIEFGF